MSTTPNEFYATGKRKTSIARVHLRPGTGEIKLNEKSLDDLRQRVRKTIDYVQSVPAAQIDGSDAREISVPRRTGAITMTGEAYLKHFALPNFFFHVTTTYALLRRAGRGGARPRPGRGGARRG